MRNSLICIFLFALSLFACTEADDLVIRDGVVVLFTTPGMESGGSGSTRAETNTYVPLDENATVRILVYRRKGANADLSVDDFIGENTYVADSYGQLSACVVNADGQKITGAASELRLIQGAYDFYAITPAIACTDHETLSVKHGVDYATSLTTASIPTDLTDLGKVTLNTLERKCSKLEFSFDRETSNVTQIDIDEVTLTAMSKAPLTGTLNGNLPDAILFEDMTLPGSMFKTDETVKYKATGSKIVLPKPAGDITVGMKLRFNGSSSTQVTLKPATVAGLALAKGTRYAFKVTLKGGSVELTLTVADWAATHNITADNLGASNSLTVDVGEWENVNINGSTGGNSNTSIGDWTANPDWEDILGEYSGLTSTTTSGSGWGNENNSNPSTGGSTDVNGGDWGNQNNGGMNNGGTSTDDWGNSITPDGELGK